MFGLFDCLSAGLRKKYWPDFQGTCRKGASCAKEKTIIILVWIQSQGGYSNDVLLSLKRPYSASWGFHFPVVR